MDLCQCFVPRLREAAGEKDKSYKRFKYLGVLPNIKYQISNIKYQISNTKHQISRYQILPDDKEGGRQERCSVAEKEERVAQGGDQAWVHLVFDLNSNTRSLILTRKYT